MWIFVELNTWLKMTLGNCGVTPSEATPYVVGFVAGNCFFGVMAFADKSHAIDTCHHLNGGD